MYAVESRGTSNYKTLRIAGYNFYYQQSPTGISSGPFIIEIEMDNRAKALPKIDRFTKLSQL